MSQAPYYPRIEVTENVTRFGAIETTVPQLYKNPISGKVIYEIDTLEILKEIWGANILMSRDYTYKLVSGSCSDEEYRRLLQSYYKKFAAFSNYVNAAFLFGDPGTARIRRLTEPARKLIDSYSDLVIAEVDAKGAKLLMRTHDYIYCALPAQSSSRLELKGVVAIC